MKPDFKVLKEKQRANRHKYPEGFGIRVHRALSWLNCSEHAPDEDSKFIFLWIGFNAAYAQELDNDYRLSEKASFTAFIKKLLDLDQNNYIYDLIWKNYSGPIRAILNNPYVSYTFWQMQAGIIDKDIFEFSFQKDKEKANRALSNNDSIGVISILFENIYTLRNQIFHGGATWMGKINRPQIHDATKIMEIFLPAMIEIMLENPGSLWGDAIYPVIDL